MASDASIKQRVKGCLASDLGRTTPDSASSLASALRDDLASGDTCGQLPVVALLEDASPYVRCKSGLGDNIGEHVGRVGVSSVQNICGAERMLAILRSDSSIGNLPGSNASPTPASSEI